MRYFISVALFIALFPLNGHEAIAQGDFFWSPFELGGGATNSQAVINTSSVGDTGSIYLYYSTENSDIDTGAGLNLSWDVDGVIAFTSAVTFDFNIVLSQSPDFTIGQRWGTDLFPDGVDTPLPAQSVTDNEVVGLNAFETTSGQGILENNNGSGIFLDQGYDAGADAYLFGRVEWERVGAGEANLITDRGQIGIVHDGQSIFPKFGGAVFASVPEPSAVGILLCGILGLARRHRV